MAGVPTKHRTPICVGVNPALKNALEVIRCAGLLALPGCGGAVSSRLQVSSTFPRVLITIFRVGNDSNILSEKATHFFTLWAPAYS